MAVLLPLFLSVPQTSHLLCHQPVLLKNNTGVALLAEECTWSKPAVVYWFTLFTTVAILQIYYKSRVLSM